MTDEKNQEKKIIVDEDWKDQAQKEKENLAEEEKTQEQTQQEARTLPPADFAGLISMLMTQALFSLGVIQMKEGEKREPDFIMAKYNIDMLEVLAEKTKGNLSEEEDKLLTETLSQVKMAFVQLSK